MRFRQHNLLALLVIVGLLSSSSPVVRAEDASVKPPRKILTGWIPYYRTFSSTGKNNGGLDSALKNNDLIKEVMPFWFQFDSPTKIDDLYTPANPNNLKMLDVVKQLKDAGYAVIPTMTDGTSSKDASGKMRTLTLSTMIADSAGRESVAQSITDFVLKNGFDGIDLDFENFAFIDPNSSWDTTRIRWVAFIKLLASKLHANQKILSMTTPVAFDPSSGKKGYYVYGWQDVGNDIDRLRIMTYDYSTSSPGPIGPISWVEQAVQWAIKIMPASKVFIGLPGYGRDWVTSVSGSCPTTPINYSSSVKVGATASTFVMRDAIPLAMENKVQPTYQAKYGESTFTYQKTYLGKNAKGEDVQCIATRTAWYQDAQGFALRANLIPKYRLGGLTQWTLGMEDPAAIDAIRAIAQSIAPDVVNVLLQSSALSITYGDSLRLSGALSLQDKSSLSQVETSLEMKQSSMDWNLVETSTTSTMGNVDSEILIGQSTQFRLTSTATWERLAGNSPVLSVGVTRRITWREIPLFASRNQAFTVTGRIEPGEAIALSLRVKSATGVQTVRTVSDNDGYFSIPIAAQSPGLIQLQVSIDADQKFLASVGDFVTVLIR